MTAALHVLAHASPQHITKLVLAVLRYRSIAFAVFLLASFAVENAKAYDDFPSDAEESSITMRLSKVGVVAIQAVFVKKDVYIPVLDVLNFAHVKADVPQDRSSVSGFLLDESNHYSIDFVKRSARVGTHEYKFSATELYVTETEIYLRTDVFQRVFGFSCDYDPRAVQVAITSERDLPAVAEARRKRNRESALVSRHRNAIEVDQEFGMHRPMFSLGVLDWFAQSTGFKRIDSLSHSENYRLTLGGGLLGGDVSASLTTSSIDSIRWKDVPRRLLWHWRFGIPNSDIFTRINIGNLSTFSSIGLSDSILGFQLTNHSTERRESFSTYVLTDFTEPEWNVELYVNDALVDFTKADINGRFSFRIPLDYGSTGIKLKFYGRNGQVVENEREIRVPYTFLPPGNLEYSVTGGTYKNDYRVKKGVGELNVKAGITNFMTLGGGATLDRSVLDHPVVPFGTISLAPFSSVLISGQYQHGTGAQADLSWSSGSFNVDASYIHPMVFPNSRLLAQFDQRRLVASFPIVPVNGNIMFSATDMDQGKGLGTFNASSQLNFALSGIPIGLTTAGDFGRDHFHFKLGALTQTAGFSLPVWRFSIRPQLIFDVLNRKLLQVSATTQLFIVRGLTVNLLGFHDPINKLSSAALNFQFRTPMADISTAATSDGKIHSATVAASGSIMFDGSTGDFVTSNTTFVQRAGIVVRPFLDQNSNGVYDPGEPLLPGVSIVPDGGLVQLESNGMIRVLDLEPYTSHIMRVSMRGVENVALMPAFKTFRITLGSTGFTEVDLPIGVGGQVSGNILFRSLQDSNTNKRSGLGGVRIKFQKLKPNGDTVIVQLNEDLLSYSTGEYYYMGLSPGKYRAYVDPQQLAAKKYSCSPASVDFELKNILDGDSIEGLNFTLSNSPSLPQSTK